MICHNSIRHILTSGMHGITNSCHKRCWIRGSDKKMLPCKQRFSAYHERQSEWWVKLRAVDLFPVHIGLTVQTTWVQPSVHPSSRLADCLAVCPFRNGSLTPYMWHANDESENTIDLYHTNQFKTNYLRNNIQKLWVAVQHNISQQLMAPHSGWWDWLLGAAAAVAAGKAGNHVSMP